MRLAARRPASVAATLAAGAVALTAAVAAGPGLSGASAAQTASAPRAVATSSDAPEVVDVLAGRSSPARSGPATAPAGTATAPPATAPGTATTPPGPAASSGAVAGLPGPAPAPEDPSILASLPSRDSWLAELGAVTSTATAYLDTRLARGPDSTQAARSPNAKDKAKTKDKSKDKGGGSAGGKPAIVLDIDNTSLQTTYQPGVIIPAVNPTLTLAKRAKASGAAVIFVTARPEIFGPWTRFNLDRAGYAYDGLYMRSTLDFSADQKLKTRARQKIEESGYTIVANIGNRSTDLEGGHSERTFKYPDYDGKLS